MTGPTLISATPSAFARINRIALMEKGVPFELKNEVPWNSDTETPQHNPLEKLPILVLEDGSSVYDSSLIQDYILHKYSDHKPSLLPEGWDKVFEAKKIQVLAQGHMDAMVLRNMEINRDEKASKEWLARQNRKIAGAMKAYAAYVDYAQDGWLVGGTYSIADIAVGCAIDWVDFFRIEKEWRTQYPALAKWWQTLSERKTFKDTTPVMFEMRDKVVGGSKI